MCLGLVTFLSAKTQMLKIYMFTPANPLSASITKWSNTLKQFVANLPTNCLSVFDHFVILALEGLKSISGLTFY